MTQSLSAKTEENHEDPTSGYLVSDPRTHDLLSARQQSCHQLKIRHANHFVFVIVVSGRKRFGCAADI